MCSSCVFITGYLARQKKELKTVEESSLHLEIGQVDFS